MTTYTVTVSGTTYYDCLDPLCTGVPGEHDWPDAEIRRRGTGKQATYRLSRQQAVEMAGHLDCMAEVRMCDGNPEDSRVGRVILRDRDRVMDTVGLSLAEVTDDWNRRVRQS